MLEGETAGSGAQITKCDICGEVPLLDVQLSTAGYYVGYWCCSPYSRETGYFKTRDEAVKVFNKIVG